VSLIAFPWGPWEPDKDAIDTGVCVEALNVFPKGNPQQPWYGPVPDLRADAELTAPLPGTDPIRGIYVARRSNGTVRVFAATTQKWYKKTSSVWTDLSGALTPDIPSTDYWSFQQFGDKVYVSSFASGLHSFEMHGGTEFVPVAGSPKAKYIAAFGPFLVAAHNKDNPDNLEAFEFRNSNIEAPDDWTPGPGSLADVQIFPDGGQITGLIPASGNDGYVVQESKIRRAIFQPGADIAFRFEVVEERRGAALSFSAVGVGGTIFYLAEDGFYAFGPQGLQAIGSQRVNEWFRTTAAENRLDRTQGFVDAFSPRVGWAFYTNPEGTYPDRVIYYDWQLDRWTHSNQPAHVWSNSQTEISLDQVTNIPHLAAMGVNRQLRFQNGPPKTAVITTGKAHFIPGAQAVVTGLYPIGEFGQDDITLAVGKTPLPWGYITLSEFVSPSISTATARFRAIGRIHQASIRIVHDPVRNEPWAHCQGIRATLERGGTR
jgi:hypothetical protein